MPTRQEIFEKVQAALVDALGVEEEEVTPQATLVGDLGAESIDFLDIQFRLNKAFNIKIDNDELYPQDVLTNPEYVQDGKITESGMVELRRRMPYANLDRFSANPTVQELSSVLTVEDLCRFVETKVGVNA